MNNDNGLLVWNPGNSGARGGVLGGVSGSIAGAISAATDLFAIRNGSSSKSLVVSQIEYQWVTTTAFGAAQALLFGLYKVTGFTVLHSAGAGLKTLSGVPKRTTYALSFTDIDCVIAGTADITGHTYAAPDADEPFHSAASPSHSVTPTAYGVWVPDVAGLPLILEPDEGVILRPLIALGATGVGLLTVHAQAHAG